MAKEEALAERKQAVVNCDLYHVVHMLLSSGHCLARDIYLLEFDLLKKKKKDRSVESGV